ncbi:MAG: Rieske 2Fe-2S domain-containing protein [Parasulfuritortus sp.]|jgi:Rieske Fe-S protein|nr:Rieske 2Fe-2S domain-containing protein [Parasulfuritortus sp.]
MDRRGFVKLCTGTVLTTAFSQSLSSRAGQIEAFPPAKLVKADGSPLKASEVGLNEAMVFAYPFNGIPCYLINLGNRTAHPQAMDSTDDGVFSNPEGVGKGNHLVAFIAICSHQLSYPTPEISYLRYANEGSELAGKPGRIVCCAHGSVYDPAEGARVESGPAPAPLLPVALDYDAATDGLTATGVVGKAFIQRFFKNFKGDLIERYGAGVYRQDVGETTKAVPLSQYSAVVPAC